MIPRKLIALAPYLVSFTLAAAVIGAGAEPARAATHGGANIVTMNSNPAD
ncbi:hypothetical protein [Phenylobacterium sp.]|nr:hypothetical protein [Phenylobacterium sp.]